MKKNSKKVDNQLNGKNQDHDGLDNINSNVEPKDSTLLSMAAISIYGLGEDKKVIHGLYLYQELTERHNAEAYYRLGCIFIHPKAFIEEVGDNENYSEYSCPECIDRDLNFISDDINKEVINRYNELDMSEVGLYLLEQAIKYGYTDAYYDIFKYVVDSNFKTIPATVINFEELAKKSLDIKDCKLLYKLACLYKTLSTKKVGFESYAFQAFVNASLIRNEQASSDLNAWLKACPKLAKNNLESFITYMDFLASQGDVTSMSVLLNHYLTSNKEGDDEKALHWAVQLAKNDQKYFPIVSNLMDCVSSKYKNSRHLENFYTDFFE